MLSIIICTYNRDKYLYDALRHIASNDFPTEEYEIVLVNNNSTDQTENECQKFIKNFPLVSFHYFLEKKQGLSHARNRGIQESKGDILVFLDDDSFVKPNYLHNLQLQLNKHHEAMAFGGKITPRFESGVAPKWLCRWNYSWLSAIDKGDNVIPFDGNSYPIGANMGFRKECLVRIGEFNTELGRNKNNLMGGEEKDLINRIKELQMPILYFPDIEVEHVIPEKRTTKDYIIKMAYGIGLSERLRCLKLGKTALLKRHLTECFKWAATLVLWIGYALQFRPIVGNMLVLFRWHVTKGLHTKHA